MQATETFQVGAEQFTVAIDIDSGGGGIPLVGDVSGVLGDVHIVGDLNLTGDVFSEGLLTGIDTFHVQGNGFSWFFQHGGRADLHGKVKGKWGEWGTGPRSADTTGWVVGDRLAIAPTAATFNAQGVITNVVTSPIGALWSDWSQPHPSNVTQSDGSVRSPEVVNLSQSIVFENLGRGWHIHDEPGVFDVSDVRFLNCGTSNILASYPIHFHFCGESVRGSVLTRVVVEGGKNHAFVPHASHGISFIDCVAVNTMNDAFWWDLPPQTDDEELKKINNSNDTDWNHCLVLGLKGSPGDGGAVGARLTGFLLGAGTGNKCRRSVAVGVEGFQSSSGFHWPERGIGVWEFPDNSAHNCKIDALFVWQNSPFDHVIDGFTAYQCLKAGIEHGAYSNFYKYRNLVLTKNLWGMFNHALSWDLATIPNQFLEFENVLSDTPLRIAKHNNPSTRTTFYRNVQAPSLHYGETANGSVIHYEDGGWVPLDFNLSGGISPNSIIEIKEGGVLTHRWQSGVWS